MSHAGNWQGLRDHRERMASCDALGELSKSGKMIIAGDRGKDLLSEYTKGLDEINSKF
jgi:hypothetical protein